MEREKQYYPLGIQSFEKIRTNDFVYVDKTMYIRKMTEKPGYFFLSRPRRFGKSLYLSTLEAYFKGRRELFKGLDIDTDDVDWTPRPVFRFAFNDLDVSSYENVIKGISFKLEGFEREYNIDCDSNPPSQRLYNLIENAYQSSGRKVAVLIDEYDSVLLSTLGEDKQVLYNQLRELFKSLFTVMKTADEYIHFCFITGVSRFSHTSLFSGANNIPDKSLDVEYNAFCGITEEELVKYFSPGIRNFADRHDYSFEEALHMLKENYDGYHFSEDCPDVYNPYSVLRALDTLEIDDYWFGSGTPSYLINALKREDFYLPDLECTETESSQLTAKESFINNPVSLMYETGYLTIKDYDTESRTYTLGIPNQEVAKGLAGALIPIYSYQNERETRSFISKMRKAILKGEPEVFMSLLQTFLSGNPYSNTEKRERETYFKNNIFLVYKILGFNVATEEQTCNARTDMVLKTRKFIYIFELKVDKTPEEAIKQIEDKGYANPYRHDGRQIILIGANYSTVTNNIDIWKIVQN